MLELGFLCENSDASAPDSLLEAETFTTTTAYDALNRATSIRTPHNSSIPASEILPSYNEASLLEKVDVKLRGATTATNFVQNIDYDAKGQRERIQYGNGSTTGYTYDNAVMESFFASLKKEQVHHRTYADIDEVKEDMFRYIELFYNRKRLHSSLGYLTPVAYRLQKLSA